ncbi:MAG: methionine--tRNA ligase [Oscillospiraceae bacterium]|jgi:methionyl-tRNA synthetase|nr:methionine--tRNA ligase [Oscillospiraceae bacterium]
MEKFYITTAIAYTSGKPHIGNNYEIVLTDAIARYMRMKGKDVFFLTGTDEHGEKIEKKAKEQNIEPQVFVDNVAKQIEDIVKMLNCSYDKFIRTTDPYHEKVVQKIFKKLYEQGDIYKGEYEGMYCDPCESFWTNSQLIDGKCPDCNRPVTAAKEEAYFLKLSDYQERLEKYWDENVGFACPESRRNEMLNNFIKPGVKDLCVSRTSFKWGIPVDFDDKHVVYVWLDALSNYITALGYDPDGSSEDYKKYWPADVHIIGKDILRFHTIYWPIILMALGEELPKKVYGHPWLLVNNKESDDGVDKMSKSKGNVIYADELVEKYGVDGTRYVLLSVMPYGQDGFINLESFTEIFNTDLANTLGNLVNRTIAMSNKYFGGIIGEYTQTDIDFDIDLKNTVLKTVENFDNSITQYKLADACECLMNLAKHCNKYIDLTTPWVLAKDEDKTRLQQVLYNLLESIRYLGVLLFPIIPKTAEYILDVLKTDSRSLQSLENFGEIRGNVGICEPLFARIVEKK